MSELETIQAFVGLGVGGMVAIVVLLWKRADDKAYADRLTNLIGDYKQQQLELSKQQQEREKLLLEFAQTSNSALKDLTTAIQSLQSMSKLEERLREIEAKVKS